MVTIKCSEYEKGDMIRILNYARNKKIEDSKKDNKIAKQILNIDLKTIDILIDRVNGKYREDYYNRNAKSGREKEWCIH